MQEKTMNKRIYISTIFVIVLIILIGLILICFLKRGDNILSENNLEARIEYFFGIVIDENIISSEIRMLDYGVLHAELLIAQQDMEKVFGRFLHRTREVDVTHLPSSIVEHLLCEHEIDFFVFQYISVDCGGFFRRVVETQNGYIVFMKERDGNVLIVLNCTHADGNWRKSNVR